MCAILTAVWVLLAGPGSAYVIPAGSMMDTLLVGDVIMVDARAYDAAAGRLPARGDVAVFRRPEVGSVFVYRVIGLPGDTIQMRRGDLVINGETAPRKAAGVATVAGMRGEPVEIARFEETLPNGRVHAILDQRSDGFLDETPPMAVPAGHVFMMGDNRDNAADSRLPEVGPVPAANLMGRAERILCSADGGPMGRDRLMKAIR